MSTSEELVQQAIRAASALFPLAQGSMVYRASIAYVLQQVKSFVFAIQPLKNKELTQLEIQALQRFNGTASHFATVLPHLGKKWVNAVLNWPSTHIHNYVASFRRSLCDICEQLSLDPEKVIKYEKVQDNVNKTADLKHLKEALIGVRESAIACPNSVDIQQLIEVRLRSIRKHLPAKQARRGLQACPSSDAIPVIELKARMDKELSVFTAIDIPCEDLRLDEALGCGGFGTVFKAIRLSTSEVLAVKEVRSDRLTMSTWASLYSEVATMAPLRHKYVLELVGAHIREPYRIITRFCPGKSLFDRLHRTNVTRLNPDRLTAVAYQVAEGMKFLHANGIVHRDLKTMNILLDENDVAKIADFGLAGMMRDNKELIGGVGTPHYTAPEVLERKRYGPKVDAYSYGLILWEMATGQVPFREKTHQEIYDIVVNKGDRMPFTDSVPPCLRNLIMRCWAQNPNDRPDFSEIVSLFEQNKIKFQGCDELKEELKEPKEGCPPLDMGYLIGVLKDPADKKFPQVVNFLASKIDDNVKAKIRAEKVIETYTEANENLASILVLLSVLLAENEFAGFVSEKGTKMIEKVVAAGDRQSLVSACQFLLKVPDALLGRFGDTTASIVAHIEEKDIGEYAIRLLARTPEESKTKYHDQLLAYFGSGTVSEELSDQSELDALAVLLPFFKDEINESQWDRFIELLEKDLDVPINLVKLLISKTGQQSLVRLTRAIIKASVKTNVTEELTEILLKCQKSDIEQISKNYEVFDTANRMLEDKQLVTVTLLLIFFLVQVPSVPMTLANHPVLHTILQLEGHVAQRLQIFTCLCSSEQFCSDTTTSDGVVKLLISSLSVESLIDYALRLIGSLSSHAPGCALVSETGMLSLFTQMFLSSRGSEMSISLQILSNAAKGRAEIPQISLIVSCLMQDLLYSRSDKCAILNTLCDLVTVSPNCVQEHDIQNSVMPLISPRQEPIVVSLVLKLLYVCDSTKFRGFYQVLAHRIYTVLRTDTMQYPELLTAALEVIAAMTIAYDMVLFIQKTELEGFTEYVISQLNDDYSDLCQRLNGIKYVFEQAPTNAH